MSLTAGTAGAGGGTAGSLLMQAPGGGDTVAKVEVNGGNTGLTAAATAGSTFFAVGSASDAAQMTTVFRVQLSGVESWTGGDTLDASSASAGAYVAIDLATALPNYTPTASDVVWASIPDPDYQISGYSQVAGAEDIVLSVLVRQEAGNGAKTAHSVGVINVMIVQFV